MRLQELTGILSTLVQSEIRHRAIEELNEADGYYSPIRDVSSTLRGVIRIAQLEIMEIRSSLEESVNSNLRHQDCVVQELFPVQSNVSPSVQDSQDPIIINKYRS